MKTIATKITVLAITVILCSTTILMAKPTNGDFNDGLNGWTAQGGVMAVGSGNEAAAVMYQDESGSTTSVLSQIFFLDTTAQTLSFDILMEVIGDNGGGETDTFTAALLNSNGSPLVSVIGAGGNPESYFYLLNSSNYEEMAQPKVSVNQSTVEVDVSGLAGQNVELVFTLEHDLYDDELTSVLLDNITLKPITVVPAPGSATIGIIGISLIRWLTKRKQL